MYRTLRRSYGSLSTWWPAESSYEVFIGAILTQQTQWKNVENAMKNLKNEMIISPYNIANANIGTIKKAIRPAGFYIQKAKRIKLITQKIIDEFGSFESLNKLNTPDLRSKLISYNGIGDETADSILLYAFGRESFVVDAYTKRILGRLTGRDQGSYANVQQFITSRIKHDINMYKEFHAQLVELAKRSCKAKPICLGCPLSTICTYSMNVK
jgi:endonuclease-3 related protein